MALNIRNLEVEQLATAVARLTGETKTEAVRRALEDRLMQLRREKVGRPLLDELNFLAVECGRLPVLDDRSADEILGYDEMGMPG